MSNKPKTFRHSDILSKEEGFVIKEWGGKIPIAIVYPNRYGVGMSNLGFQLVYHMLNREPDVVCERIFLPEASRRQDPHPLEPPLSLESRQPLRSFEILAFSVPFENDYPNVLRILAASGIPLEAGRRLPPHPMVWMGGVTAFLNPEPMAPFVDLFAVGEAEELLPDLLRVYRRCRAERLNKEECLEALSQVDGAYVPSLYEVRYDGRGLIRSFRPRRSAPPVVCRRIAEDLSRIVPASRILTPLTEFESLFLVEIGRGCLRGCRFCAGGHVFRPARHRPLEVLLPVLSEGLERKGRIGLVSPSVGDHPQINDICKEILSRGGGVSVASLRMDALEDPLLEALARSGHKTLSLAPETGSQRLREMVHKGLDEERIMDAVERISRAGIPSLRLYFMIGLPLETQDDVDAIAILTRKILHRGRRAAGGRGFERLTLSVNPFVPKPATPFQWHPFMEEGQLKARIKNLRQHLKKERAVTLTYEPPKWAKIQALLARGDRRLKEVLIRVSRGTGWAQAFTEVNINPDFYVYRAREVDEILPWDFIDHGWPKEALWRTYRSAMDKGSVPEVGPS